MQAYFAEFGQCECVYFAFNGTSNKQVLCKNMVPMLYKYVSVCIEYLHYIYVIQTAPTFRISDHFVL